MALTKPTLLSQVAFDSNTPQTILFNVVGGSQVVGNRLKILNNTTGVEVYNQVQTTYKLEHIIPNNSLINGTYYVMQIQTIDAQGGVSVWSNSVQFYCYTNPILAITNIPSSSIINNAKFNFEATYTQLQGELLNSYKFSLYNNLGIEISNSGIKYIGSTVVPPTNFNYSFSGFEDNTSYQIEVIGTTVNGTSVTSGKIKFTADYIAPSIFAVLQLENDCENGWVNITSNIIDIEGKSNPSPPIYIGNNKIDLRTDGYYVLWESGYTVNNNFKLRIWGEQFNPQKTITVLYNSKDNITNPNKIIINFRQDYVNAELKTFAEMYCYNEGTPYYCYSNYIPNPSNTEQVFIWLVRIDNIFEIKIENRGVIV